MLTGIPLRISGVLSGQNLPDQEPRQGGFSEGVFCRIQRHAQENKQYLRILDPAVHVALGAPENNLREIAPRVSTRWQISSLLVNFCVKNMVKFRWQILSLFFLGKLTRNLATTKSTRHFPLKTYKFHHLELLGALLRKIMFLQNPLLKTPVSWFLTWVDSC